MVEARLYSFVPLMRAAEISSLRARSAAIGAFNVNFYAQAEGILEGLKKVEAPGIIQASKGANKFQGGAGKIQEMLLLAIMKGRYNIPIALHLDHGDANSARDCIDNGFSSVMIDASHLPELENIAATKEIVLYAHPRRVGVEAEYGLLSGVEEDIAHQKGVYADPKFVPVFFDRSKTDALAIAYGTSHGPNKGKTEALNVDIVRESYEALKAHRMNLDRFLVSHGSSTVPAELVDEINRYGGSLKETSGVPEHKLLEAIDSGIRKINIDTDLRLGITATFRKYFHDHPDIENRSEALGLVKAMFDGKIPAKDKDGKPVDPAQFVDPRSYLQALMNARPEMLRQDYRDFEDEAYAEVMGLIGERVASHVCNLARLFRSNSLAGEVGRV